MHLKQAVGTNKREKKKKRKKREEICDNCKSTKVIVNSELLIMRFFFIVMNCFLWKNFGRPGEYFEKEINVTESPIM